DMIQVIPSIAIRKGRVVKMRKGDPTSEKAYDENVLDLAKRFEDHGIDVVHLVDLDGAETGSPVNYHVIEAIRAYTSLKVDFTGGIMTRSEEHTSELQSRENLVCRLLLEKKNR